MGASDKPETGYDTRTAAADLLAVMDQLGYHRFSLVGHDVGMWLSYAAAADAPERISRLVLMEANLPGISAPRSALPDDNRGIDRQWHFMFNRLPEINERLVEGREQIYFGYQFAVKGATPTAMPAASVEVYLRALRQPGALHAAFHYYRALEATIKQNRDRAGRKPLQMPVLAVGGGEHRAETVAADVRAIARDVTPLTIDGCGHYVAEEAPTEILAAMLNFLLD